VSAADAQQVWLIRHAETEWSVSKQHTGRTDIPLLDEGRDRARELAPKLAAHDFSLVLSSPLGRARETASLAGLGDRAQLRDDLLEWDYGEYEATTTATIHETRPDWYLWRDGAPGGETPAEVCARADRVVEEALGADGDVALFGHGHVLRAIGARWLEADIACGGRLALGTGAVCVLGFERDVRVLWSWNDTSA
jgi:broad specificity phosphatase PhoE